VRAKWTYEEYRDRLQLLSEMRLGKYLRSKTREQDRAVAELRAKSR
jgi:hypothetical protein